jgi:hypothetical protein
MRIENRKVREFGERELAVHCSPHVTALTFASRFDPVASASQAAGAPQA